MYCTVSKLNKCVQRIWKSLSSVSASDSSGGSVTISRPTISVPIKVERLSSHDGDQSGGSVEDGVGHHNAQYQSQRSVDDGSHPEVRHRWVINMSYPCHRWVLHMSYPCPRWVMWVLHMSYPCHRWVIWVHYWVIWEAEIILMEAVNFVYTVSGDILWFCFQHEITGATQNRICGQEVCFIYSLY